MVRHFQKQNHFVRHGKIRKDHLVPAHSNRVRSRSPHAAHSACQKTKEQKLRSKKSREFDRKGNLISVMIYLRRRWWKVGKVLQGYL